ncbi:MAG: hypothetical protein L6R40_008434, partial [Gallowayella cf. fulva]
MGDIEDNNNGLEDTAVDGGEIAQSVENHIADPEISGIEVDGDGPHSKHGQR